MHALRPHVAAMYVSDDEAFRAKICQEGITTPDDVRAAIERVHKKLGGTRMVTHATSDRSVYLVHEMVMNL